MMMLQQFNDESADDITMTSRWFHNDVITEFVAPVNEYCIRMAKPVYLWIYWYDVIVAKLLRSICDPNIHRPNTVQILSEYPPSAINGPFSGVSIIISISTNIFAQGRLPPTTLERT